MKLQYTWEEIEHWRDRVHRRSPKLAVATKQQALEFINEVGYCFAFKSENSELPCLWHAACGSRDPMMPTQTHHDPYLSFVWEMKNILPSEGKVYYGKLLKRRPTMISMEYVPYFYALSQRSGAKDEYVQEHLRGELTSTARDIMEALTDSSPQVTKGLKLATGNHSKGNRSEFEKGITELQTKMFIVKVAEQHRPFTFVWAPFYECFPAQVRKARIIPADIARLKILEQYFEDQLIGSVESIYRLFRWSKQVIYQTLGNLVQKGVITSDVTVEGNHQSYYCYIHRK